MGLTTTLALFFSSVVATGKDLFKEYAQDIKNQNKTITKTKEPQYDGSEWGIDKVYQNELLSLAFRNKEQFTGLLKDAYYKTYNKYINDVPLAISEIFQAANVDQRDNPREFFEKKLLNEWKIFANSEREKYPSTFYGWEEGTKFANDPVLCLTDLKFYKNLINDSRVDEAETIFNDVVCFMIDSYNNNPGGHIYENHAVQFILNSNNYAYLWEWGCKLPYEERNRYGVYCPYV